jgi:hypothetical protein
VDVLRTEISGFFTFNVVSPERGRYYFRTVSFTLHAPKNDVTFVKWSDIAAEISRFLFDPSKLFKVEGVRINCGNDTKQPGPNIRGYSAQAVFIAGQ